EELRIVATRVVDPPADASAAGPRVLALAARRDDAATADRAFRILFDPDAGCGGATQFVGFIPPGRAPDHFHRYDELICVLEGTGALHIGGASAPLRAGSCIRLPAGTVHCVENAGPGLMRVLGVFRPAGSPAAAFYPDGSAAPAPA
ncbi:MAG TPA: cupin domain-containing protein, partial [Capillimicrobium sp.]